jgi:hypothetical protein
VTSNTLFPIFPYNVLSGNLEEKGLWKSPSHHTLRLLRPPTDAGEGPPEARLPRRERSGCGRIAGLLHLNQGVEAVPASSRFRQLSSQQPAAQQQGAKGPFEPTQ